MGVREWGLRVAWLAGMGSALKRTAMKNSGFIHYPSNLTISPETAKSMEEFHCEQFRRELIVAVIKSPLLSRPDVAEGVSDCAIEIADRIIEKLEARLTTQENSVKSE